MFGLKRKIEMMNPSTTFVFFLIVAVMILGMLAINFVALPFLLIYVAGIFGFTLSFLQALGIWTLFSILLGGITAR